MNINIPFSESLTDEGSQSQDLRGSGGPVLPEPGSANAEPGSVIAESGSASRFFI